MRSVFLLFVVLCSLQVSGQINEPGKNDTSKIQEEIKELEKIQQELVKKVAQLELQKKDRDSLIEIIHVKIGTLDSSIANTGNQINALASKERKTKQERKTIEELEDLREDHEKLKEDSEKEINRIHRSGKESDKLLRSGKELLAELSAKIEGLKKSVNKL